LEFLWLNFISRSGWRQVLAYKDMRPLVQYQLFSGFYWHNFVIIKEAGAAAK
jgi:hypothetical protein